MFDQFSKDFDVCAAGGEAYPKMLNNDWLLFTGSCGSGFDDGSGLSVGCDEVKKVVEPTLKLNAVDVTSAITYKQFTAGDTGVIFDVPSDVTVTENMNGVPGLSKFIYNDSSYLVSYSAEQGDNELAWGGNVENQYTATKHDNINVYSENGYARTAAFFLQPHPLANITVTKKVGAAYKPDSETSSDLDEVYQRLVSSVRLNGIAAF
ncbi:MAG: hypothetical protein Q8P90_02715 [bacterium]|nr:hypothetical protein [bacterium]